MDPDCTYHGRFAVTNFAHTVCDVGNVLTFNVNVMADPFKKSAAKYSISAVGGVVTEINVGGASVTPLIISGGNIVVEFNKKTYNISSPAYKSTELSLPSGVTSVYICSAPIYNCTWGDMETTTWGQIKNKRLCEWYTSKGTVDQSIAQPVTISFDRSEL